MTSPCTRRPLAWDTLEDRRCPSVLLGPYPQPLVSTIPVRRSDPASVALQSYYAQEAARWTPNVAIYGDSITYGFGYGVGSASWGRTIAPLDADDFGVPGETTQNLLWRIEYGGELVGHPRVAVVAIGTNNLIPEGDSPAVTAAGIEAVASAIHAISPTTKVLLMGLLPYGGPSNPYRSEIVTINAALASYADDRSTFFLNIGPELMNANQRIGANFEPDLGHPNAQGYAVWADTMIGTLDHLLGIVPAPSPPPIFGPMPQR